MFKVLLCFIVTLAVVAAGTVGRVQMERDVNVFASKNWLRESKPDDSALVRAVFALKHDKSKVHQYDANLLDIATPSSKNYGKWLKSEQVVDMLAPSKESLKVVTDFLASYGIVGDAARVSKHGDMVHVTMPVGIASQMLQTEFGSFRSAIQRDIALLRITKPYSLPAEVANVVSLVDDILRFPSIRRSMLSSGSEAAATDAFSSCGSSCAGYTTPEVLKQAYSFPGVTNVAAGNSMSVAEFQNQYFDTKDLNAFSSACGTTVTVDTVVGGNKETLCETIGCVEALLDIEYIGAIAHPVPLTVVYSSTYSLLNWADTVTSMAVPPLVHSVSYGNDEVQQTSVAYMNSVNEAFMIAGSMGLSVLFASGDQGVWGRTGVSKTYNPDFPASSPYVTSVGGTNFAVKSVIGAETTWNCGGGGFSNTFARPSWQQAAVSGYLSTAAAAGALPSAALFNSTGRAYPDVAALGGQTNPYCVSHAAGSFSGVAGTSASCPVVAGIFAQLNNVRLAAGKAPLGWLNPFIYSNGQCFNDVNDGSQNNCNAGTTGFQALNGWDPATGFGTPNYQCLAKQM